MKSNRKSKFVKWSSLFVLLFGASISIHTLINNTSCYFDDAVYWSLGRPVASM